MGWFGVLRRRSKRARRKARREAPKKSSSWEVIERPAQKRTQTPRAVKQAATKAANRRAQLVDKIRKAKPDRKVLIPINDEYEIVGLEAPPRQRAWNDATRYQTTVVEPLDTDKQTGAKARRKAAARLATLERIRLEKQRRNVGPKSVLITRYTPEGEPGGPGVLPRSTTAKGATLKGDKRPTGLDTSRTTRKNDPATPDCKERPQRRSSDGSGKRSWVPWCDADTSGKTARRKRKL